MRRRCTSEPTLRHARQRVRLALGLMLAWLALPADGGSAQELSAATRGTSSRLPVQIVQEPAHQPAATPAPVSALPLKPPPKHGDVEGRLRPPTAASAITTVITSLAVVLGLFMLSILFVRKAHVGRGAILPGEVVQTLGRAPLNGRQEMHLVRVGNKLLLLSVTATGAETLTEITEPDEIDRLAGICQQSHPDSITASFREILWQCGQTQRA